MAARYIIGVMSYSELEYDQPQEKDTICKDFWNRYNSDELGQGEMYEIDTIDGNIKHTDES